MKIHKKILIFAVLIGLLTVIGLSYYLSKQSASQKVQIPYSKVVVANNTIPANIQITADMVTLKSMPAESVHPEAITDLNKVVGSTSKSEIVSGEQVLKSRIVNDSNKANAALAYKVPKDMRAISIPNTEVTGVAGNINVGDKIDILVTYGSVDNNKEGKQISTTYTQLQNIEVVAVGSAKMPTDDKQKGMPASITVLVKPEQAEVLAYATLNGAYCFTLRNPIDSTRVGLKYYNSTNFTTYLER